MDALMKGHAMVELENMRCCNSLKILYYGVQCPTKTPPPPPPPPGEDNGSIGPIGWLHVAENILW